MPSFISSLFSKGSEEQEKDTSAASNLPAAGVEEGDVKWSAIKTAVEKVESKTRIEPAHPVKESAEAKAKNEIPSATSTTTEKNESAPLGDCSSDSLEETIPGKAPSPVELGNSGWNILHSAAAVFPYKPSKEEKKGMEQLLYGFSYTYACSWCAYHMRLYLKDNPPEVEHKHMITQYICRFHNNVNEHLKKPLINCNNTEELLRRWHPGYPDRMQDKPSWEVRMAEAQKKLLPTTLGHGSSALAPEKAKPTETGVTAPAAASSTSGGARVPTTTAVSEKHLIGEGKKNAPPPLATTMDPIVRADEAALSAVLEKGGFTPEEALLQANEKMTHAGRIAECSGLGLQEENRPPIDGPLPRFLPASSPSPSMVADNISRHIRETFVTPDKVKVGETLSAWWQDARLPSRLGGGNAPAEDGNGGSERVPSPRSWIFSTPWTWTGPGEAPPDPPTTAQHPIASWLPTFGIPSLFSSKEGSANERGGSDAFFSRVDKPHSGFRDGGERENKMEVGMGDDGTMGGKVDHPIRSTVSPAEYSVPGFIAACFPPLFPPKIPVEEGVSHPIGDTRSAATEGSPPRATTADHVSRLNDDPAAPAFSTVVSSAFSLPSAPMGLPSCGSSVSAEESVPSRAEKSWWGRWWPGSGSESSATTGTEEERVRGNDASVVPSAPPLVATVTTPVSSPISVPHVPQVVPTAATKATPDTVSVEEKPQKKAEGKTKRSEGEPRVTASPSSSSTVASPVLRASQDSENARSLRLDSKRNDLPGLSLESMLNELGALLPTVKRASPEVEEMIQMLTHSAKEGSIKVTEKAQKAMEHILQMKNDTNFPASIQGIVKDQLEVLQTTVKDLQYSQHAEALEAFLATIRNEVKNYVLSKDFGLPTLGNEKNVKGIPSFPPTSERTTFKGSDGETSIPPPPPNSVPTTELVKHDIKGTAAAALSQVVHSKGTAGPSTLTSHESESKKEKVNMMELMKSMNDCDVYCPEDELLSVKPLKKEHGK